MSTVTPRKIKDWCQIFADIYISPDSNRTPEQMWIAVVAHSSTIGECVRRYFFSDLMTAASHAFCWLCSFINRCNTLESDNIFSFSDSLCEIVSLKYPLVCGHCEEAKCHCSPIEIDKKKDKSARYGNLLKKWEGVIQATREYSIDNWKYAFREIFGGQLQIMTLETIGFHFLEEVGEGAVAVRQLSQFNRVIDKFKDISAEFLRELSTVKGIANEYIKDEYKEFREETTSGKKPDIDYTSIDQKVIKWRIVDAKCNMVIEIADTFSWFCSLLNKLDNITESSGFEALSLENQLNKVYFEGDVVAHCPTCKSKSCSCVFFS